jgi:hypothetical protein
MTRSMNKWLILRGVAYLGKIAKELKRMNDLSEARYPVVAPRKPRQVEISHPTIADWNKREEERIGYTGV